MFYSLVYVSSATALFTTEELKVLLAQARENNSKHKITGMLLYKEGNFMQLLEGEEQSINALYQKIAADKRHQGALVMLREHVQTMSFPDWSMGFTQIGSTDVRDSEGYSDVLLTPPTGWDFGDNPTKAQKLLLSFKKSM